MSSKYVHGTCYYQVSYQEKSSFTEEQDIIVPI